MTDFILDLIWGMRINIYLALIALPIGFVVSIFLALGLNQRKGLIYYASSSYVYFFRGSPIFIQFFFFYYLLRASGIHKVTLGGDRIFEGILGALTLAPIVLVLNTAAYSAVIFSNALKAVPKGDLEAADAFGFSPFQKFWRITWPGMMRIAWPAYTNEAVFLFLATSLTYASLPLTKTPGGADYRDAFRVANDLALQTFNPFAAFLPGMAIFVLVSLGIFFVFGLVNQYLNRHLPDQSARPRLRFRPNFIR